MTEAVWREGRVKFFDAARGFGFVILDDGCGEVFVHHSQILKDGYRTLSEGERVSFMMCTGPKGRYAEEVRSL